MSVAVVTMVYNEPEYLPIWCGYYGRHFGAPSCYIIDHGSNDGSLEVCRDFNVVRIPRSAKDNDKRTRFVSHFCSSLLERYDAVIYVDVDEILVSATELPLQQQAMESPEGCVSAYGFDAHHVPSEEPAYEAHKPVTWQRQWLRFSSSMCKVVLTNRPIEWSPGFHSANAPLRFGGFYLFHLRYFDLNLGLKRLARTRAMAWASPSAGAHQRVEDKEYEDLIMRVSRLPKIRETELHPSHPPLEDYISKVAASEVDYNRHRYNIDLHIFGDKLLQMPAHIIGAF